MFIKAIESAAHNYLNKYKVFCLLPKVAGAFKDFEEVQYQNKLTSVWPWFQIAM